MTPERKKIIANTIITEYYWAGDFVVYVNNKITDKTFNEACNEILKEAEKKLSMNKE